MSDVQVSQPPSPAQWSSTEEADKPVTKRHLEEFKVIQDQRFQGVHEKLEQHDRNFEEIKGKFDKVDWRFKGLEGRFVNMAAREPWDEITPVEYRHHLDQGMPSGHPDRLVKLWRLQKSPHRNILISLLEFYDVSGWQNWGFEDRLIPDSDSEWDDAEEEKITLPTAVATYPWIALRALTQRLGVDHERMKERMLRWEQEQLLKRELVARSKRTRVLEERGPGLRTSNSQDGDAEIRAKLRRVEPSADEATERPLRLPLSILIGRTHSSKSKAASEPSTRLEWKPPRSSDAPSSRRRFRDKGDSRKDKSKSEESTVPYEDDELEQVVEDARREIPGRT